MATATFAERIQDDLAVLIADKTLIDLSRQRDATATQETARTLRVCQMAAAKVESKLGDVGSFDDTDGTIGDQTALDFGVRVAMMLYSQMYSLTLTEAGRDTFVSVMTEIDAEADVRRQEAGTPVIKSRENTQFNARHTGDDFPDKDDSDAP